MGSEKNETEKLRIAMLGHKRIPSREGGIEVVVEELATRILHINNVEYQGLSEI